MDLLIHTDGITLTKKLQDAIESKIGGVEQYAPRAIRARVHVRKVSAHAGKDQFMVKVLIELPGKDQSAMEKGPEPIIAIDIVAEKIERKLRGRKTKRIASRHKGPRKDDGF